MKFYAPPLLYRLALEQPQFLLLAQQVEPFGLADFGLVRTLQQSGELAVEELIAQTQRDIGELLRRIGDRARLRRGLGIRLCISGASHSSRNAARLLQV